MQSNKIIITGFSGFIGSNLVKNISKERLLFIDRDSFVDDFKIFDSKKNIINLQSIQKKPLTLIHLATYFSKLDTEKEKILEANLIFGEKILNELKEFHLKNIIYTNSMYKFYKEDHLRNSVYCKSKNEFSNLLSKFCINYSVKKHEIFLDNTFGKNDLRNKIVPLIVESIKNGLQNPINNPKNKINLVFVNDVVKYILSLSNETSKDSTSSLFNDKSIVLKSIYEFLNFYIKNQIIDETLIKYAKNNYIQKYPENKYSSVSTANILLELSKLI